MITFQPQRQTAYAKPNATGVASPAAVAFTSTSHQPADSIQFGGRLKDRIKKLTETETIGSIPVHEMSDEQIAISQFIGKAAARIRQCKEQLASLKRDATPHIVDKNNRNAGRTGRKAEEYARHVQEAYVRQLALTNLAIQDYNRLISEFNLRTVPKLALVSK